MTSWMGVLPSIYAPFTEACLGGMAPEFREHVAVVDNAPPSRNRGVAASWNLVARRVLEEQIDWLVIISAATRFGAPGGMDFIAQLEHQDVWMVETGPRFRPDGTVDGLIVGWHLMGWSRICLERIGLFDENFRVGYGEDADQSRRALLAMDEERCSNSQFTWGAKINVDAWIAMQGHGYKLAGVQIPSDEIWRYYRLKWAGAPGHESFDHPFGDPQNPLSFWPVPPDPRSIIRSLVENV